MSTNKTHWKRLYNPNYIGAYSFNEGEKKTVTIKEVKQESVQVPGGAKDNVNVLYFTEKVKPLICNKTNAKTIAKITSSNYIEDWLGHRITLEVRKVSAFGDLVEAVRVSNVKPKKNQLPLLEGERLKKAIESVKANEITLDRIQKSFRVKEADLKKLKDAVQV